MSRYIVPAIIAGLTLGGSAARADIVIEAVTIGDAGNTPDSRYAVPGYGAVGYAYRIGKYEVTNGEYIAFLNATAFSDDPHGLYSPLMGGPYGGIAREGSMGACTYRPKDNDQNWLVRPVNHVSWYNCLRFANWLHNGQPVGLQNANTTEDGAYDLSQGEEVIRKPGSLAWLPNLDEWYKAAYYKGNGLNAGYWDYATQSDAIPFREPPPGHSSSPGSANYYYAVDDPYHTTGFGAYPASPSGYGTFDQNGNVFEYNETLIAMHGTWLPNVRGGGWNYEGQWLHAAASSGHGWHETDEYAGVGFRVALIPEPCMAALLVLAGTVCRRRRRARPATRQGQVR